MQRTLAALLLAGATSAALGVAVAAPASAADNNLIIRNQGNLKCLQPVGGSVDLGVPIVQEPCDGTPVQQWSRVFVTGGSQFVNRATGLCLDARGGATNGTPVQQWACNTISNEKWGAPTFFPAFTTVVSHVSGTSSHCLDNPGQSTDDGTAMQLWSCNGTVAQLWFIG
jgi:hypothetical protein